MSGAIKGLFLLSSILLLGSCETTNLDTQDAYNSPERPILSAWQAEALALLDSDAFHRNLSSLDGVFPEVWVSRKLKSRTPTEISRILRLQDPLIPDARRAPATVWLKGKRRDLSPGHQPFGYKGDAWASAYAQGYDDQGRELARIDLDWVHFARYTSENTVERSCAMNTMTHEIGHTFSRDPARYKEYFLDTGWRAGRHRHRPRASYLVGTVAQCTYLQNEGAISQDELQTCLKVFGTTFFNSVICDEYDEGAPIIPTRSGRRVTASTPSP